MKSDLSKASEFTAQLGTRMGKLYEMFEKVMEQKHLIEDDFSETLGLKVELRISENALFHVVLKEPFLGHGIGTEWSVAQALSHCYDKFDVMDM